VWTLILLTGIALFVLWGQHMTPMHTITVGFTASGIDNIASVLSSLKGWCFQLNGITDVLVRSVDADGITVRTIPETMDQIDTFEPREFRIHWSDINTLTYA